MVLFPCPKFSALTSAGVLGVGLKLYTYEAGTTTPLATYTDSAGGTPNQNPVELDARGEANVWFDSSKLYKLVLKTAADVTIWTVDNVGFDSGSLSYLLPVTGAVSRSVESKLSDIVSVTDFGAIGDGTTNDTAAIQAAITGAGANSLVVFPKGTYKVTSPITIANNRVHLAGAGPYATQITFAPTANGTLFKFINASTTINQGSLRGMTLWSDDSTYAKTAIEAVDLSGYRFEDLVIGGSVVVGSSGFWSGGGGSIGINTKGRDTSSFRDVTVFADKPIKISVNPNSASISIDHFNFHNLYLGAAANPCVTIDAGVVLTQVSFTGHQAWVVGHGGLYWVDATTPGASNGLYLNNVRYENPTDNTKYFIRIDIASGLQQLHIRGGQTGGLKGFYLRGINQVLLSGFHFALTGYEGLNINSTVSRTVLESCFWQTGTTATLTGMQIAHKYVNALTTIPEDGFIVPSPTGSLDEIVANTLSDAEVTLAASGTLVLGGPQQTGFIMVTTGDNNSAMYELRGGAAQTAEITDTLGQFSGSQGTPSSFNIYWDSGTSKYLLENGFATSKQVRVIRFGRAQ